MLDKEKIFLTKIIRKPVLNESSKVHKNLQGYLEIILRTLSMLHRAFTNETGCFNVNPFLF